MSSTIPALRAHASIVHALTADHMTRSSVSSESTRAGAALVLSKTASTGPTSGWETYKSTSPVFQKLSDIRERYDESEDPFISTVRSVTSWFGRLADENETAKVTRLMRQMDPGFEVELFARELREYIIPEVLDAYLTGDQESLKGWCGEAAYSILWATMSQFKKQQLLSESRVITIANLDVSQVHAPVLLRVPY